MRPLGSIGRLTIASLGTAAVLLSFTQGTRWTLLAAAGGAAIAVSLARWALGAGPAPRNRPLDFAHTLDLLARAHDARAAWAIGLQTGDVAIEAGEDRPDAPTMARGDALVRLASVDGRVHVAREEVGTFVATGDFPYGAGVLLAQRDAPPEVTGRAAAELRRLIAGVRIAEVALPDAQGQLVARRLALHAATAHTLDGVARAGAELAQDLSQRPAAVLVHDPVAHHARIVGLSSNADYRLHQLVLDASAPACRAIEQGLPLVTSGDQDIFGPGLPERRRRDRSGTAYPLLDGHTAVGALVLLGPPVAPDGSLAEQIGRLVMELGPRIAAARSVHEAERRAVSDPLTGLANRREFERTLGRFGELAHAGGVASLIYADLDHFKRLNDTLGHAAGDAALRHVKGLLEAQVREGDLVARIGGEEFAVWLPQTGLAGALEVAERMRRAIEQSVWHWHSGTYPLTTSCGVAAFPESTGEWDNLPALADAALYRAKGAGRNRVVAAEGVAAAVRAD